MHDDERPAATPSLVESVPQRIATGPRAFLILLAALSPLALVALIVVLEGYSAFNPLLFVTLGMIVALWLLAAALCWLVVDRLALRPLRRLTASVRTYHPGAIIDPLPRMQTEARELRELGEAFHAISAMVARSQDELADGLERQRALSREIHHRVKNNLQIVASLISLHARGAQTPEAAEAYAVIMRRVDALAVVQRYNFADVDDDAGVQLKPLMAELLTNLRSSHSSGTPATPYAIRLQPVRIARDRAIAIAFLVTELVELAMMRRRGAAIEIAMDPGGEDGSGIVLSVASAAFVQPEGTPPPLRDNGERVTAGLTRQLRARLDYEPLAGRFSFAIPG